MACLFRGPHGRVSRLQARDRGARQGRGGAALRPWACPLTPGDACSLQIRYWKAGAKAAAAERVRTAGLDTSALVTGLHASTKYHVTVRAYNRAGTGPASPSANATTMKPRESGSLGAGGAGGSRITLQGHSANGEKGVGLTASVAPLFCSFCWSLFLRQW